MAFSTTTGSETVTTTEHSIITDTGGPDSDTTDNVQQAMINFSAMAAGDVYRIRVYESDGTTQRVAAQWHLANAQTEPHFFLPPILLMVGSDITVTKIAGTDRAITWAYSRVT